MSQDNKKFPFRDDILKRFCKWIDIKQNKEIDEALVDLTGDTYFEMRKLISQLLTNIEELIVTEKYCGYVDGKKLTEEQKQSIKEVREDLKEFTRMSVEATWRSMLNKQKIGIDKLSLSLRPYIKINETDLESSNDES